MIVPKFFFNKDDLFTIYFFIRTGSVNETLENNGISHALEHMIFKSSKQMSSLNVIKSLTRLGGLYNAVTDKDVTYYYVKTNPRHWKEAIETMISMIFYANLQSNEWANEKKVVIEEILNKDTGTNEDPMMMSLFPKQNTYTMNTGGSLKSIQSLTAQKLKDYYQKYYFNENNIDIVVTCPKNYESRVRSLLETKLPTFLVNAPIEVPQLTGPKPQLIIDFNTEPKKEVTLMFQSYHIREWKHHIILNFLNYMLAKSGLYSILMYELREKKGLLYGIQCNTDTFQYISVSYIRFSTQYEDIHKIIKSIMHLVGKIKDSGVDKKVLTFYKDSYLNLLHYIFSDDDYMFLMKAMNHHYGVYDYSKAEYINVVKSISNDDIRSCANDIYDFENMGIYIQGNVNKRQRIRLKTMLS